MKERASVCVRERVQRFCVVDTARVVAMSVCVCVCPHTPAASYPAAAAVESEQHVAPSAAAVIVFVAHLVATIPPVCSSVECVRVCVRVYVCMCV